MLRLSRRLPPVRGTRGRRVRGAVGLLLTVLVAASAAGCGEQEDAGAAEKEERAVAACRAQWEEVGHTILGMEQDSHPSALAERWTTVVATVEYYKTTESAEECQRHVETQLDGVAALRQFSEKLRPYDMTYQRDQARAAVDLYLHEPLPRPTRGDNGKLVRPPTKAQVAAAMQVLTDNAEAANLELAPGWEQAKSVDLTDVAALTKTMQDLDFLAQDSPRWQRCEEALQVLVAAIRAQEGL